MIEFLLQPNQVISFISSGVQEFESVAGSTIEILGLGESNLILKGIDTEDVLIAEISQQFYAVAGSTRDTQNIRPLVVRKIFPIVVFIKKPKAAIALFDIIRS